MINKLPFTKAVLLTAFLSLFLGVFAQVTERLPCVDKKFLVVAHIFKDSSGQDNITQAQINDIFERVNKDFAPICISFEVCEFQYHDNFQYDMHEDIPDYSEMQNLYHVNHRINIYYVNNINTPANACGYAGLGQISNVFKEGIVIQKSGTCCGLTSKTHSHELGHYFSLEHTFMNTGTTELVDGSNCSSTADGICDTPADPFIKGTDPAAWVTNCRFVSTAKDANGEYYDPIVGNIMSYYPDECSCGFTDDQLRQMAAHYLANLGQW